MIILMSELVLFLHEGFSISLMCIVEMQMLLKTDKPNPELDALEADAINIS